MNRDNHEVASLDDAEFAEFFAVSLGAMRNPDGTVDESMQAVLREHFDRTGREIGGE